MKTLGKILMILIAALVVIGAAYALVQTTTLQMSVGQSESSGQIAPSNFANEQFPPSGELDRGGPEGRTGSFETVVRNLLIIAALIAVVQGVWTIGKRVNKPRVARS
jgi:hypothetical protein